MKQFSKDLGNVSLAPKGKWSREQEYERLALVYNACDNLSYVAKINVPSGVDIENREYWQPMNATGYADNNFINLTAENENGTITAYESIEEAIATIVPINRRAGATLSFYNLNSDRLDRQAEFELWQFNSTDLANWENIDYWNNIYYNWNVFAGWYIGADALKNHVKLPTVGQYAYVGTNLNDALLYQCRTNGVWTNTGIKVRNYISVVVSGNITIGDNGNWFSDGKDTGIPATPAVDEQLDNICLQLQQHATEIDKLQKQDVVLKSNIDSNFETINNKVDNIKTATNNKIDAADANLQNQIISNDTDIATLNTKHESLSKIVQGIAVTGGASIATNVTYDKTNSGLNAENTQDAIDEVSSMVTYDVSACNGGVVFESLQSLLSSDNLSTLIPTAVRCGGMSIRFIQSSDNKYVQYRLMKNTWSTTITDWQGVDDEPTVGSQNLVKSGGVAIKLVKSELVDETIIPFSDYQAGWYGENGVFNPIHQKNSGKIAVSFGQIIKFKTMAYTPMCLLAAFNGNTFVSSASIKSSSAINTEQTYVVPEGVTHIAVSTYNSSSYIILTQYYAVIKDNAITYNKLNKLLQNAYNKFTLFEGNLTPLYELSDTKGYSDFSAGYYNNGSFNTTYQKYIDINVTEGQKIIFKIKRGNLNIDAITAFNANNQYVSASSIKAELVTDLTDTEYIVPSGITKICISSFDNKSIKVSIFDIDTYNILFGDRNIDKSSEVYKKLQAISLQPVSLGDSVSLSEAGWYSYTYGVLNSTYQINSGKIAVNKGDCFVYKIKQVGTSSGLQDMAVIAAFDSENNYVKSASLKTKGDNSYTNETYIVPDSVAFIAFTSESGQNYEIHKADVTYSITELPYIIKDLLNGIDASQKIAYEMALPSVIHYCINTDFNIYKKNIRPINDVLEDDTKISFSTDGRNGMEFPDRLNNYAKSTLTMPLNVLQKTAEGNILSKQNISVQFISDYATNDNDLNVLCIGDSITDIGYWVREVQNKFYDATQKGGCNIRLIGNIGRNPQPDKYSLGMFYEEGHSAWTLADFMSTGRHRGDSLDGDNPFWNPNSQRVDFDYYVDQLNTLSRYTENPINNLDVVVISLGTNDSGYSTYTDFINNLRTFVEYIWQSFPTAIVVFPTIPPQGVSSSQKTVKIKWNYEIIQALSSGITNSYGNGVFYLCGGAALAIDRIVGYCKYELSHIPNSPTYQSTGLDYNLHPNYIGGFQYGDAIFSEIIHAIIEKNSSE